MKFLSFWVGVVLIIMGGSFSACSQAVNKIENAPSSDEIPCFSAEECINYAFDNGLSYEDDFDDLSDKHKQIAEDGYRKALGFYKEECDADIVESCFELAMIYADSDFSFYDKDLSLEAQIKGENLLQNPN